MKFASRILVAVALLTFACSIVFADEPSPLQDFCVSTNTSLSGVFVDGMFRKDPNAVSADDFFFSGLNLPRSTDNPLGSNVIPLNVDRIMGLNTLRISLAHIDFAPYGLNPRHTHPRGTEILVVLEGTLYVGFVTSNPNRLITKVLTLGDVLVFPIGLIHFQFNVGISNAVAFSGLSNQNPGVITIANAVSDPIPLSILLFLSRLSR